MAVAGLLANPFSIMQELLFTTLSTVAVAWLTSRFGRNLRLKFDGIGMEANTPKEIEAMVAQVIQLRESLKNLY
ncbi:MAG: hypothetical protein LBL59_10505 [Xanthomonadaceae bacterium]|nr:hypothetical protein [Xanthomonadaceae bacterium]